MLGGELALKKFFFSPVELLMSPGANGRGFPAGHLGRIELQGKHPLLSLECQLWLPGTLEMSSRSDCPR